jgi:hypothetical protein
VGGEQGGAEDEERTQHGGTRESLTGTACGGKNRELGMGWGIRGPRWRGLRTAKSRRALSASN